jgi:oligo-1,6-glucosidase
VWNAQAERADPTAVFAHHKALIELRHSSPVVSLGDFTMLLPDHQHVYAFTRSLDGETLLVVCNVGATPYRLAELLPEAAGAELVLGNLPDPDPEVLAAWDARVLRLP